MIYELRELYLFTIFLKFINIFPLQFSAHGCTKKRKLGAVLVPISYPTEVVLFILKQSEKLEFHSLIGIQVSSDVLSKWKLERFEAYYSLEEALSTLGICKSLTQFRIPWLLWAVQLQVTLCTDLHGKYKSEGTQFTFFFSYMICMPCSFMGVTSTSGLHLWGMNLESISSWQLWDCPLNLPLCFWYH